MAFPSNAVVLLLWVILLAAASPMTTGHINRRGMVAPEVRRPPHPPPSTLQSIQLTRHPQVICPGSLTPAEIAPFRIEIYPSLQHFCRNFPTTQFRCVWVGGQVASGVPLSAAEQSGVRDPGAVFECLYVRWESRYEDPRTFDSLARLLQGIGRGHIIPHR